MSQIWQQCRLRRWVSGPDHRLWLGQLPYCSKNTASSKALQSVTCNCAQEHELGLAATQIEALVEILELAVADNLLQPNQVGMLLLSFS